MPYIICSHSRNYCQRLTWIESPSRLLVGLDYYSVPKLLCWVTKRESKIRRPNEVRPAIMISSWIMIADPSRSLKETARLYDKTWIKSAKSRRSNGALPLRNLTCHKGIAGWDKLSRPCKCWIIWGENAVWLHYDKKTPSAVCHRAHSASSLFVKIKRKKKGYSFGTTWNSKGLISAYSYFLYSRKTHFF